MAGAAGGEVLWICRLIKSSPLFSPIICFVVRFPPREPAGGRGGLARAAPKLWKLHNARGRWQLVGGSWFVAEAGAKQEQ